MIKRYTYPKMEKIWSEEYKYKTWLEVEIAICEGWAELGVIPKQEVEKIKERAEFNISRIEEIEKEIKHDLLSFVKAVCENLGEEGKYLHFGVTSYDVVDTSLSLRMKKSADIIIKDIINLMETIKKRAQEHKWTIMIGRTHGVHAEPITFGFKLAGWLYEMERNLRRIKSAKENISYGKISGAVGTYANIDPQIEEFVCKRLKLKPAPVSTQILQRDIHAEFLCTLAIIAASIEKFATEIRNLQRTEILEVEEYFEEGQRGSSSMPHKRNPITCEQLAGLARLVRANSLVALENISLWHERDLTNSAPERIVIPDSCILVDYILQRFREVMEKLVIYPQNMQKNLEKTAGIICSQKIMLKLIEKGLSREEAYQLVQKKAMECWESGKKFEKEVLKDKKIKELLSPQDLKKCQDLKDYIKNIEVIYKRFGI